MFNSAVSITPDAVSVLPISNSKPNGESAHKKAGAAEGYAWANLFLAETYKSLKAGVHRLIEVREMTQEGRSALRVRFNEERVAYRQSLKNLEGYEKEVARAAFQTVQTRMSEIEAFSKACDLGLTLRMEQVTDKEGKPVKGRDGQPLLRAVDNYSDLIGEAREMVASAADNGAAGPTRRRGRKQKAGFLKLLNYVRTLDYVDEADKARVLEVAGLMDEIIKRDGIDLGQGGE